MRFRVIHPGHSMWLATLAMAVSLLMLSSGAAEALTFDELKEMVSTNTGAAEVLQAVKNAEPMALSEDQVRGLIEAGASEAVIRALYLHDHVTTLEAQTGDAGTGEPDAADAGLPVSEKPAEERPGPTEEETPESAHEEPPDETRPPALAVDREESTTDHRSIGSPTRRRWRPEEDAKPPVPVSDPLIFNAPAGRLIPTGVVYSHVGLDTGGGFVGSSRVGLGNVAEFGLDIMPHVRFRECPECEHEFIVAYPLALFRIGVNEGRVAPWVPGFVLGFRKSFQIPHQGRRSRLAELSLALSKTFGESFEIHLGGVLWDGEIVFDDMTTPDVIERTTLHDEGLLDQVRGYGGIEIRPLEKARLLFELYWVPRFQYGPTIEDHDIDLRAMFVWGVRNELFHWMYIDAGVRVPDIVEANLLDAQIFGQATFILRHLHDLLDD